MLSGGATNLPLETRHRPLMLKKFSRGARQTGTFQAALSCYGMGLSMGRKGTAVNAPTGEPGAA